MEQKNRFISATYQLYSVVDGEKELEEQTGDVHPFQFITGFGISLEAFERNVASLETGAEFDFTLQPAEAFGEYDPNGVHKLEREAFTINGKFDKDNVYPGATITLMDEEENRYMAKVVKIEPDGVILDTNHPYAGKVLNFVGKIQENREATEQEIQALIKQLTSGCSGCGGGCDGGGCGKCEG